MQEHTKTYLKQTANCLQIAPTITHRDINTVANNLIL